MSACVRSWRFCPVACCPTDTPASPSNCIVHQSPAPSLCRSTRQAGGHWFEPSTAHLMKPLLTRGFHNSGVAGCPVLQAEWLQNGCDRGSSLPSKLPSSTGEPLVRSLSDLATHAQAAEEVEFADAVAERLPT